MYRDFTRTCNNIVIHLNEEERDDQEQEKDDSPLDIGDRKVIWIVGGPGSDKHSRVEAAMSDHDNWSVISVGKMLRESLEDDDTANNNIVNEDKHATQTSLELLKHGNLVPDVRFQTYAIIIIYKITLVYCCGRTED